MIPQTYLQYFTDAKTKNHVVRIYNGILLGHKNKILPFVTALVDLEGIMLSKIIQTEKDKYCMISFRGEHFCKVYDFLTTMLYT